MDNATIVLSSDGSLVAEFVTQEELFGWFHELLGRWLNQSERMTLLRGRTLEVSNRRFRAVVEDATYNDKWSVGYVTMSEQLVAA